MCGSNPIIRQARCRVFYTSKRVWIWVKYTCLSCVFCVCRLIPNMLKPHTEPKMGWSHPLVFAKQALLQIGVQVLQTLRDYGAHWKHACTNWLYQIQVWFTLCFKLALPDSSVIHPVFHASQLKVIRDRSYSEFLRIVQDYGTRPVLNAEPKAILGRRLIKKWSTIIP
jgi:hypothetical protein